MSKDRASAEASESKVLDAFGQLRSLLQEADQLTELLELRIAHGTANTPTSEGDGHTARIAELERQVEDADRDRVELTEQLIEADQQAGKLVSLYVATYQLHVSLDPTEVQSAIAEIARDLLGAEAFVLLIKDETDGSCDVALTQGDELLGDLFSDDQYTGGDPMVDATLEDGILRLDREPGSGVLATVPLRVEDAIVGALVIIKTLDHKVTPLSDDRDILDLLAAHAASALFAARVYSKTDRKLRTLQSLVNLIRGA